MNVGQICNRISGRMLLPVLAGWLAVQAQQSQAATWNVTNYGAMGDCTQFRVTTKSNSATVFTTNLLGSGAVGKVMEIFGAGQLGINTGQGTFPTSNQDLVVTITAVSGTNVTISGVAGATTNALCTFGTNNAIVFQNVINMANNGDTIQIPAGNFLLLPAQVLNPSFTMANYADGHAGFIVNKGGLTFQGAGTNNTILTACGAWQVKGAYVCRGTIAFLQGPITIDGPVVFDGISFDGGVSNGRTGYDYYPAVTSDGDGWDVTHHAIEDAGTAPLLANVTIQNCRFVHWRGEILIGVVPLTDGFRYVTNCSFYDGEASAINFSFSHRFSNCRFDTLKEAEEFYEGYCTQPCVFENSVITNIVGITGGGVGIALGGAQAGRTQPSYTIQGNTISVQSAGLFFSPVWNVNVISNTFINSGDGVMFGSAGYQGTTNQGNILVNNNIFSNVYIPFAQYGAGPANVQNVSVISNTAIWTSGGNIFFATGVGYNTNILFQDNVTIGFNHGLDSTSLTGQWFIDDVSNQFPPWQINDAAGVTNVITYADGMRQQVEFATSKSLIALDDTHPQQVPPGAVLVVGNTAAPSIPVYTSASLSGSPVTLTNSNTMTFSWAGNAWQPVTLTNASMVTFIWTNGAWAPLSEATPLAPPTDLHVLSALTGQ